MAQTLGAVRSLCDGMGCVLSPDASRASITKGRGGDIKGEELMSTIAKIALASDSKSFKKRNPHLFKWDEGIQWENTPDSKSKKRIRQSVKPLLNKLETEFFERLKLQANYLPNPIPQAIKLRISRDAFYKPDFFSMAWIDGRPTAWEVKELRGKNVDRGKLALKVAASTWPEIRFIFAWKEWQEWFTQEILP